MSDTTTPVTRKYNVHLYFTFSLGKTSKRLIFTSFLILESTLCYSENGEVGNLRNVDMEETGINQLQSKILIQEGLKRIGDR